MRFIFYSGSVSGEWTVVDGVVRVGACANAAEESKPVIVRTDVGARLGTDQNFVAAHGEFRRHHIVIEYTQEQTQNSNAIVLSNLLYSSMCRK